jgi:hypothetical protein
MKASEFIYSTAADRTWVKHADGDAVPEVRCPWCNAEIVYNGNYFCSFHEAGRCNWAMDHPVRRKADRAICDALGIDYL